jgi:phage repressor protein C with HTH and peptisase S24 domain
MTTSKENSLQNANSLIIKLKSFYKLKKDVDLAEKLGITQSNLSLWKSRNSVDFDLIFSKCKDLDKNWWLSDGDDEYGRTLSLNEPKAEFITDKSNAVKIELSSGIMRVPLVSQYAYAGYLGGYSDVEFMEGLPTIPFIIDREYKGIYLAFEVRGDSMDDGSRDSYIAGDILLSRQVQQTHWRNKLHIKRWDFVIVHKTDGILLKKIINHIPETGDITAHSLNPDYDDIELNLADVVQLFNVVKVERKK